MKPGSQSGTYEDDIFEVIANLHVLRCKFGEKMGQFGGIFFEVEWMLYIFYKLE